MDDYFQQNCYSRSAKSIFGIGYNSTRLIKDMAYSDEHFENIKYFDFLASVPSTSNEIS